MLRPSLTGGVILLEDAVHRAPGAVVLALIEQGGVDRARGLVDKALAVEQLTDGLLFLNGERPMGARAWSRWRWGSSSNE